MATHKMIQNYFLFVEANMNEKSTSLEKQEIKAPLHYIYDNYEIKDKLTVDGLIAKLESFKKTAVEKGYKNIEIHFNRKDAINSELDIYIPSLKLAFELNGIFHYEPIYGKDKLDQIQNNDNRKFQACMEKEIELCIIDSSSFKHFKEEKAKKYLDIIVEILKEKTPNKVQGFI